MTTREKLDYRDRTEQDEKLDYRDENTEGREEHRTEHPNSSYQAANQPCIWCPFVMSWDTAQSAP